MRQFAATVVANELIMPATHVVALDVGRIAQSAAPGQFLHIRCSDNEAPLLRRPMSVFRARGKTLELMVRDVGAGSHRLVSKRPGEVLDCIGPLGHAFRIDPKARNLLLIGGGYGVAPLVGLAERAIERGASVTLAVGAATHDLVFPSTLLPEEVEYLVATDDGSAGVQGFVTELVPDRLAWADAVYSCGPIPMMASLARIVGERAPNIPCWVAMEERMGCAMGVCLGCVIETRKGPMRVCTDGPVFRARDVVWRTD
ncbi:MAG TPA: dihydroorotate dehydrogenase electron transfer subunit [Chloroflexota bacterium]|nr:dihydroorotate dehydrogenase electron transfer subunit [Chloroflexota bacterium]